MAFPSTPILDVCNRVENPLSNGGAWGNPIQTGEVPFQCNGATAFSSSGTSFADGYWTRFTFGASEVYLNSPSDSADNYMFIRIQAVGVAGVSCYSAHWHTAGVGQIDVGRYDAGAGTNLRTFDVSAYVTALSIDNTHRVGLRMVGNSLSLYLDTSLIGTVSDNTYSSGYIGFGTNATSAGGFTNFGGGQAVGTSVVSVPLSVSPSLR